ncbi:uncharacterized protein LOC123953422 [Meles meles]|uniref:uncharacterized protein LOC123953422 n=1 Tax=Meles meles TaxID=9662 RepID=UPI001E69FBD9|nr:uncharacterized protein LOC123953422 [Meles meles]
MVSSGRDGECWELREGCCEARDYGHSPLRSQGDGRCRSRSRSRVSSLAPPAQGIGRGQSKREGRSVWPHPHPSGGPRPGQLARPGARSQRGTSNLFVLPTLAGRGPFWSASAVPPAHPSCASSPALPLCPGTHLGASCPCWADSPTHALPGLSSGLDPASARTHVLFPPPRGSPPLSWCLAPCLKTCGYPSIAACPKLSCKGPRQGGRRAGSAPNVRARGPAVVSLARA